MRFSAPNRPFLNPFLLIRDRNFDDGGYCGKQTLNGSGLATVTAVGSSGSIRIGPDLW
jgi:hypothetical protein